jgi:hypothetical protein
MIVTDTHTRNRAPEHLQRLAGLLISDGVGQGNRRWP